MKGVHAGGFDGKVALVCGAGAGGVGSATSFALAEAGATIVAIDVSEELVEEARQTILDRGGQCTGIVADLRDPAQVARIVPTVSETIGRLDMVVNIAGGTKAEQWMQTQYMDNATFEDVMALNFNYVFSVCRDAGRFMIDQGTGGVFVNIASMSGLHSAPFHAVYGAAKRAVVALTESMAVEWGRYGIRANTVAPGAVRTPRAVRSRADFDATQRNVPLQRPVEPHEITAAIMFLLSDGASAITGQQLVVDCGASARSVTLRLEEMAPLFERPPGGADQ